MNLLRSAYLLIVMMSTAMAQSAIGLNHFYVTVDSATYAAIDQNAFLKQEFAAFEKRTTVRADRSYTGIYFYGTQTHFGSPIPLRRNGPWARPRWLWAWMQPARCRRSRAPTGISSPEAGRTRQIPWFYRLSPVPQLAKGLESWVMEYTPEFLAQWRPEGGVGQGVERSEILKRYKSVLAETPKNPYLEDVTGLTLALPADEMERMMHWMEQLKPAVTIRFLPMWRRTARVAERVVPAAKSSGGRLTLRFGAGSVLTLRPDKTAIWEF
ncbi:MAG: DUF5829 family protein [Paludibaculum sp.]